jgi:hypothetical protein
LIYTDDFATAVPLGSFPSAVSSKWWAYPDGWNDTSKNGTYTPSKVVSVADGMMDLFLHTEAGVHLVSAPVPELPGPSGGRDLLYARYAIRFRADPVPGYKTAWLLWPHSDVWPRDGEIDFPEGDLDSTISAFMHRQDGTSGGDQDAYSTDVTYSSWHTAVLEWTATHCTFILDGKVIGDSTSRIPNTPMHWVIQTETQLSGGAPSDTAEGHGLRSCVVRWEHAAMTPRPQLIVVVALGLAVVDCSSSATSGPTVDSRVWACEDITGSLGPVICGCEFASPGAYRVVNPSSQYTVKYCIQSRDCCILSKDKTECTCYPANDPATSGGCRGTADYQQATVVSVCPPT